MWMHVDSRGGARLGLPLKKIILKHITGFLPYGLIFRKVFLTLHNEICLALVWFTIFM